MPWAWAEADELALAARVRRRMFSSWLEAAAWRSMAFSRASASTTLA